jgi:hypothetical protein
MVSSRRSRPSYLEFGVPFDANVLRYIETALSECFIYHGELDQFVLHSNVPKDLLLKARDAAEQRNSVARMHQRAPKRYVAQELLRLITELGIEGDRMMAQLVTNLCKGKFPNASQSANDAITELRAEQQRTRGYKEALMRDEQQTDLLRRHTEYEGRRAHSLARRRQKAELLERFNAMIAQTDHQARGFALERLLNDVFQHEGLAPHGSFRVVGEQIDGSFVRHGQTHLVEAKWVARKCSGSEFGAFMYKLEGKSINTRGLFISINGYSEEAIQSLTQKGALKFVCIDGTHLHRGLSEGDSITGILDRVWRRADETGEAYFPVSKWHGPLHQT